MTPAHKTLEGQIVSVIVAACGVAVAINPSNFPPKWAAVIGTVSTIALIIQRTMLSNAITRADVAKASIAATITPAAPVAGAEYVTMYDNVVADRLPGDATAVAGYVDGAYPDYPEVAKRFPHLVETHHAVPIAVSTGSVARFIDVERGNPTSPAEAAKWVKLMVEGGVYRPGVYAPLARMPRVQKELRKTGLRREQYCLWVADWNGPRVGARLLAEGYDACQDVGGQAVDMSICKPGFFEPVKAKKHPSHVARAEIAYDYETGKWAVTNKGPRLFTQDAKNARWATALLRVNTHTGDWVVASRPWDATK